MNGFDLLFASFMCSLLVGTAMALASGDVVLGIGIVFMLTGLTWLLLYYMIIRTWVRK